MPWSKAVIDKVTAEDQVISYRPSSIDTKISEEVRTFADSKDKRSKDFRLDTIVSQITGMDQIENASRQKEIESEALKLSKDIQEAAYKEAYNLGFQEGKAEAFAEEQSRIHGEIENLHKTVKAIEELKLNLLKQNKNHILSLCFYFAKRLLMKEVEKNESYVVDVIEQALGMAQSEEQVTIRVSPQDFKFLTENWKGIQKDLDLSESTRIEESPDILRGGAIIETNYGVIDASIGERLQKLENFIKEESQ